MDVLTMTGWKPTADIQTLLLGILSEIQERKPRIDFAVKAPYSVADARLAFQKVAAGHRWKLPPDFDKP
jgi:ubiquitin-protein ligase